MALQDDVNIIKAQLNAEFPLRQIVSVQTTVPSTELAPTGSFIIRFVAGTPNTFERYENRGTLLTPDWKIMGGGTRFETWVAGPWKTGEFAINGQTIYRAKQDIANSTVAPTSANAYWEVAFTAPSQVNSDWSATSGVAQILNKPTTITTDVAPSQQVLLSAPANWSTPTASSESYYIGTTALSGNYQGQKYFDGFYEYEFIADNYPIRRGGSVHGVKLVAGTVAKTALETGVQNKIDVANDRPIELKINPDFGTSDDVCVEGVVYDVTEERMADDGTVPTSGTFVYSYRDFTNPTFTTNQTLAQLKTRLTGHSGSSKTVFKATNNTTTVASRVIIHLKIYA